MQFSRGLRAPGSKAPPRRTATDGSARSCTATIQGRRVGEWLRNRRVARGPLSVRHRAVVTDAPRFASTAVGGGRRAWRSPPALVRLTTSSGRSLTRRAGARRGRRWCETRGVCQGIGASPRPRDDRPGGVAPRRDEHRAARRRAPAPAAALRDGSSAEGRRALNAEAEVRLLVPELSSKGE